MIAPQDAQNGPQDARSALPGGDRPRIASTAPVWAAAVEAGAAALVREQTSGLCALGEVCELCDCTVSGAYRGGWPEARDRYAREHARAVLVAALDVEEIARVLWINDDKHGITEHHRRLARALRTSMIGKEPA